MYQFEQFLLNNGIQLNLNDQVLGDNQMNQLNDFLSQNRQILYLSLKNNNIYSCGLTNLLSNLSNSRLECLDLQFNKTGAHYNNGQSGLTSLRELCVQKEMNLKELVLSNNGIGRQDVNDLIEIINNQCLQYLDLSWNNLAEEDIQCLFDLCKQREVTELKVGGNPIDNGLARRVVEHYNQKNKDLIDKQRRHLDKDMRSIDNYKEYNSVVIDQLKRELYSLKSYNLEKEKEIYKQEVWNRERRGEREILIDRRNRVESELKEKERQIETQQDRQKSRIDELDRQIRQDMEEEQRGIQYRQRDNISLLGERQRLSHELINAIDTITQSHQQELTKAVGKIKQQQRYRRDRQSTDIQWMSLIDSYIGDRGCGDKRLNEQEQESVIRQINELEQMSVMRLRVNREELLEQENSLMIAKQECQEMEEKMLISQREQGRVENECQLVNKETDYQKRNIQQMNNRFNRMLDEQDKAIQTLDNKHNDYLVHLDTLKEQLNCQISDRHTSINQLRDIQLQLYHKQNTIVSTIQVQLQHTLSNTFINNQ